MFEQFAIVSYQVINLRALACGEHQVVLVIAMERQIFVGQPKIRRICTHGRGVFGHISNKRQRRIANRAGRSLVERSPAGKNATLQLVLDNVQHVLTGKNSNAPASVACPINARAASDSAWSTQNESTHTLASTIILRGAPLTGSSPFGDSARPWLPNRLCPNRDRRIRAT